MAVTPMLQAVEYICIFINELISYLQVNAKLWEMIPGAVGSL